MLTLEPIIEMPCLTSGLWRRFSVHLFEGKVTLADMHEIEERSRIWHEKIKGKIVEMVVIYPSDAKMTAEERAHMAKIIKRWEHTRAASATVILAQGLLGAMHRSVLTGLQLIAPAPHPLKVFGSVPEALQWLAPHIQSVTGPEARPDALLAAVRALEAGFKSRPICAPMV